jgi:hypothetical protein
VERGVRPEVIAKSLQSLASILPEIDRPLAQLKIVAENPRALHVDLGESLMAPNGQLLINFGEAPRHEATIVPLRATRSETEWFEYGQSCEEAEDYDEAVDAYRQGHLGRASVCRSLVQPRQCTQDAWTVGSCRRRHTRRPADRIQRWRLHGTTWPTFWRNKERFMTL